MLVEPGVFEQGTPAYHFADPDLKLYGVLYS